MRISHLEIENFRGIKTARILLSKHSVLIGDNNTGKTTILEAIDLVLGPDRLNRTPPIDEHDFYQGKYIVNTPAEEVANNDEADSTEDAVANDVETDAQADSAAAKAPQIEIEVTIVDLTEEQKGKFGDFDIKHIEKH